MNDIETYDDRWKEMYRIGAVSCITVSALILFAVIAYFIWPYAATDKSTQEIFQLLQDDLFGGLVALDFIMLITVLVNVLPLLAFYIALRKVSETYAFIALVSALIAVAAVIPARPLAEMALLSEKYAAAVTEADKNVYLAAGEVFRILFDGTAWFVQTVLLVLSGLIYSSLMLKSDMFSRKLAWTGILIAIFGLGFWIPQIGIILLFLNTILTIPWYVFVGRAFGRYGW
ncbi:MAG: DUF4386 family protein [Candidatus Marinimicrobia bacterium]|nr:DUF4386 family protein [Candidatus Neomarinimicrobiota bacterium]